MDPVFNLTTDDRARFQKENVLNTSTEPWSPVEGANGRLRVIASEVVHASIEMRELSRGVYLIVQPGLIQSWEEFKQSVPSHAVALDGRVADKTRFDLRQKKWNYDHHIGVDRSATASTCRQVFDAICNNGLMRHLAVENGSKRIFIYVKEPDPDVGFAVCFLKNHDLLQSGVYSVKLMPLLELEDRFDRFCGVVRCNPRDVWVRKLAWVCEPYEVARMEDQKNFAKLSAGAMTDVIEEVGRRLEVYIRGNANGESRRLDTRYMEIGGGEGWSLVLEKGFYARVGLARDADRLGRDGCISVRMLSEDRWMYTIIKLSPFSSFPIEALYRVFNAAEGIPLNALYRWGGSDFGGGSPYHVGSALSPEMIERIVNALLCYQKEAELSDEMLTRFICEKIPVLLESCGRQRVH